MDNPIFKTKAIAEIRALIDECPDVADALARMIEAINSKKDPMLAAAEDQIARLGPEMRAELGAALAALGNSISSGDSPSAP
jgi:hypothetical protein